MNMHRDVHAHCFCTVKTILQNHKKPSTGSCTHQYVSINVQSSSLPTSDWRKSHMTTFLVSSGSQGMLIVIEGGGGEKKRGEGN